MLDNDHDNDTMRRQTLALILMMVLLWVWYLFFSPKPPVEEQAPPQQAQTEPTPESAGEPTTAPEAPPAGQAPPPAGAATWPGMPPIPTQTDPALDEVSVGDKDLRLVFTRIGARLKRASVLLGKHGEGTIQLVPQPATDAPDTEAVYPLGLRFSNEEIDDALDYRRFEAKVDDDGQGVTFTLRIDDSGIVRKRFRLSENRHVLDIQIDYENLKGTDQTFGLDLTPAYILNWAPGMVVQNEGRGYVPELVWRRENATDTLKPKDLPVENGQPEAKRIPGVAWLGFKSKYFLTALKPQGQGATTDGWVLGDEEAFRFGLYQPKFDLAPGEVNTGRFKLYLGPMQLPSLREAWPTLPSALRFFGPGGLFGDAVSDLMDWFAKLLLRNLNWWHSFIPSYGIAIILLTLLVRAIMFPLMLKQIRSMKQMQALQPELQAIKEKYQDEPQEMNKAMMEFYRERKLNPVAGCFPIFLQMPVFIALYRMLWKAFELRGANFLWVSDLSQPDHLAELPFMQAIPFIGQALQHFNLLPILVGLTMVLSFRLQPTTGPAQNPQQKLIMNFMPIMFGVISYTFPAGLNLYVFTSTLFGIVQNYVVRTTDVGGATGDGKTKAGADPDTTKPGARKPKAKKAAPAPRRKKPQHFYDRAHQRKKDMAKAGKKRKKK